MLHILRAYFFKATVQGELLALLISRKDHDPVGFFWMGSIIGSVFALVAGPG